MIPTHGRPAILDETLARLALFAGSEPIEVIVVHDGADPATRAVAERDRDADWDVRVLVQPGFGPAPKRNRAIAESRSRACLLIGDDALPSRDLIAGHLAFHQRHPDRRDALLGLVVPAPPLDRFPFVRWLHEHGVQFHYAALEPHQEAGPGCFWTANVSVKTELLRETGGFDETFPVVVAEDIEFGYRLARAGMRLIYEPGPRAEHFHPTDLAGVLSRMQDIGTAFHTLSAHAPEVVMPRRPSARHRLKAAALTSRLAVRRSRGTREAAWRFLCDQALRESFWDESPGPDLPKVGRTLKRIALADPLANPPLPDAPTPIG